MNRSTFCLYSGLPMSMSRHIFILGLAFLSAGLIKCKTASHNATQQSTELTNSASMQDHDAVTLSYGTSDMNQAARKILDDQNYAGLAFYSILVDLDKGLRQCLKDHNKAEDDMHGTPWEPVLANLKGVLSGDIEDAVRSLTTMYSQPPEVSEGPSSVDANGSSDSGGAQLALAGVEANATRDIRVTYIDFVIPSGSDFKMPKFRDLLKMKMSDWKKLVADYITSDPLNRGHAAVLMERFEGGKWVVARYLSWPSGNSLAVDLDPRSELYADRFQVRTPLPNIGQDQLDAFEEWIRQTEYFERDGKAGNLAEKRKQKKIEIGMAMKASPDESRGISEGTNRKLLDEAIKRQYQIEDLTKQIDELKKQRDVHTEGDGKEKNKAKIDVIDKKLSVLEGQKVDLQLKNQRWFAEWSVYKKFAVQRPANLAEVETKLVEYLGLEVETDRLKKPLTDEARAKLVATQQESLKRIKDLLMLPDDFDLAKKIARVNKGIEDGFLRDPVDIFKEAHGFDFSDGGKWVEFFEKNREALGQKLRARSDATSNKDLAEAIRLIGEPQLRPSRDFLLRIMQPEFKSYLESSDALLNKPEKYGKTISEIWNNCSHAAAKALNVVYGTDAFLKPTDPHMTPSKLKDRVEAFNAEIQRRKIAGEPLEGGKVRGVATAAVIGVVTSVATALIAVSATSGAMLVDDAGADATEACLANMQETTFQNIGPIMDRFETNNASLSVLKYFHTHR